MLGVWVSWWGLARDYGRVCGFVFEAEELLEEF